MEEIKYQAVLSRHWDGIRNPEINNQKRRVMNRGPIACPRFGKRGSYNIECKHKAFSHGLGEGIGQEKDGRIGWIFRELGLRLDNRYISPIKKK